jgi:hypothetical protein
MMMLHQLLRWWRTNPEIMLPPMLDNKVSRRILQPCRHLLKEVVILHMMMIRPCTKQSTPPVDNLRKRRILSWKTLSFLHSHSDQITAIAPTRISTLNLWSTQLRQLAKILARLRGGYKVEPISIIDLIDLARWHWKNKCLLSYHDDKRHTLYFPANSALQGYFFKNHSTIKIPSEDLRFHWYLHLPDFFNINYRL